MKRLLTDLRTKDFTGNPARVVETLQELIDKYDTAYRDLEIVYLANGHYSLVGNRREDQYDLGLNG